MTEELHAQATQERRKSSNWRGWVFTGLAVALVFWLVGSSPAYQECIDNSQANGADQALQENASAIWRAIISLKVRTVCVEDWTKKYDGAIAAVGTVLVAWFTFTLWQATKRLWESAESQLAEFRRSLNIANQHAGHMDRSVNEAAKAASAMQSVAESMAKNVIIIEQVSEINREIADRQKFITELQSRAYIAVNFQTVHPQNKEVGFRFEAQMAMVNIGNTPAYKLNFRIAADVLAHPLRDDFDFPLPPLSPTRSLSTVTPRQNKIMSAIVPKLYSDIDVEQIKTGTVQRIHVWGEIRYVDALEKARLLKFSASLVWRTPDHIWSYDTTHFNDQD